MPECVYERERGRERMRGIKNFRSFGEIRKRKKKARKDRKKLEELEPKRGITIIIHSDMFGLQRSAVIVAY